MKEVRMQLYEGSKIKLIMWLKNLRNYEDVDEKDKEMKKKNVKDNDMEGRKLSFFLRIRVVSKEEVWGQGKVIF